MMARDPPIAQPIKRAEMSCALAGTMTARMNVNSAAFVPAAMYALMMPLKSTTKATTAITAAASTGDCEQSVPIVISRAPVRSSAE